MVTLAMLLNSLQDYHHKSPSEDVRLLTWGYIPLVRLVRYVKVTTGCLIAHA